MEVYEYVHERGSMNVLGDAGNVHAFWRLFLEINAPNYGKVCAWLFVKCDCPMLHV